MRKLMVPLLLVSAASMSACTYKGTTYGSGTTHEEQTLKGLYNMLSLRPEQSDPIEYSARPDLVMPSSKTTLPQPEQDAASTAENDWPVAPEEKLAEIRDSAPEPDWRTGDLPTEYLVGEKPGIKSSASSSRALTRRESAKSFGSGNELLTAIKEDSKGQTDSDRIKERKDQLAYSTGVQRKFLTEPPAEYRTPSANAEAGDLGISKQEIDERERRQRKEKWNTDRGVLEPGS